MQSKINITPDNPYSEVHIPRAKLRSADDVSTVIANPMAVRSTTDGNPYATSNSAPPPYVVKDVGEEEGGRCPACCYRCRRK